MSISSKKTAKGGTPATPSSTPAKQSLAAATVLEDSGGKSGLAEQIKDNPEQSKLAAALRGEVTRTGTPKSANSTPVAKANYKQINYTRPLYEGWVRELVWKKEDSKEGDVFYYPPQAGNEPRKKFRNQGELEAYLITSGSQFPMTFFTFKKEAVGGPEGGEVIRDAEDSTKAPESKYQESNQAGTPSLVSGKRVSKPPEKLVAEQPAESSTLTPSRMSKRVSRPPGKYSDEEPPAKVARGETGERRPSAGSKEGATVAKEPVRDWTQAVKEETMLKAKAGSPTIKQLPGLPGLKLKTFSKMSADSRNQVQEKAGAAAAASGESDVIMVEGEPETAPAPPMPPLAMSITKVKKPQMPNLPRGTLISLPGAPTTGPPPPTRSYPSPVPPTRQPIGPQSSALTPGGVSITSLGLGAAPIGGPRTVGPSPPNMSRPPLSAMPQHRNLKSVGKYLRPSKPTQLPCSIHCLGVTAIPSLSCTACHCLYHPKCVGLPHSVATSPHHQFYCSDCIPPPDKTGPVSAPTSSSGVTSQAVSKEAPPLSAFNRQQQQISSSPATRVDPQRPKVVNNREEKKPAPAPFPGQQMVNIAGKKFLVTPHPTPVPSLESPPPSPPQLPIRGSGSNN